MVVKLDQEENSKLKKETTALEGLILVKKKEKEQDLVVTSRNINPLELLDLTKDLGKYLLKTNLLYY